jgi:hypothetical protein
LYGSSLLDDRREVPWLVVETPQNLSMQRALPESIRILHRFDHPFLFFEVHELIEQNPELVATSLGIRLLNAESRSKALSLEPIEFILFRLSWSDVRRKLQSLAMGSKRISIEGQIERRDGKLFFSF